MNQKSRALRLALSVVAGLAGIASAFAQNADAPAVAASEPDEDLGEVVVTGFRASLQNSVAAKRDNISVSDSIFAEDIGKFPDLNLAESLQRIPGVQIARDFTGEGTSVAVRGLGKDFTQITLNGSPVAQVGGLKNGETSHDRAPRNLFRYCSAICPGRRAEARQASHHPAS